MAEKRYGGAVRASRRRKERSVRRHRRLARIGSVIASEFKIWIAVAAAAILLTVAGTLLFAPYFDVREMQVRRQDPRIDPEEIEQVLSPLFNQRLVLINRSQVASMLHASFPEIERVEIGKDYPSTLNITVYLQPIAAEVVVEESGLSGLASSESGTGALNGNVRQVYTYVTKKGYFAESPINITGAFPVLRVTDWGIRPQNRMPLMTPAFLHTVFLARDTLRRDFGFTDDTIIVFLRAQEFHIRTEKVTLWFDLRSPLPVQFERFRELLKAFPLEQMKEYIDLRITDKIIYK